MITMMQIENKSTIIKGRLGGPVGEASDFGSGHNLTVHGFEPHIKLSAVSAELALDPLSPSFFPSPAQFLSPSLSLYLS